MRPAAWALLLVVACVGTTPATSTTTTTTPPAAAPSTVTSGPTPSTTLPAELAELQQYRNRWSTAGASTYRMTWTRVCTCVAEAGTYTTTVERGLVTAVESDGAVPGWALGVSIDDLFDLIAHTLGSDGGVTVDYDPTYGYPARVVVGSPADTYTVDLIEFLAP